MDSDLGDADFEERAVQGKAAAVGAASLVGGEATSFSAPSSGAFFPEARQAQVLRELRGVLDPDLGRDVVSLGFVRRLAVTEDGHVAFSLRLTTPACPFKDQLKAQAEQALRHLPWVQRVRRPASQSPQHLPFFQWRLAVSDDDKSGACLCRRRFPCKLSSSPLSGGKRAVPAVCVACRGCLPSLPAKAESGSPPSPSAWR